MRRIAKTTGEKDSSGAYVKSTLPLELKSIECTSSASDLSLDDILNKQLLALERVTKQLVIRSSSGDMTKDEIQSLATCIKVTLELKCKEKEILDDLTNEELEKVIK